ncbi:regulator SirB, partial [Pseudomonas aeruginosa]
MGLHDRFRLQVLSRRLSRGLRPQRKKAPSGAFFHPAETDPMYLWLKTLHITFALSSAALFVWRL